MLMTFPTKESLLRNLNERDVSEVFLIIANFKSLAGWNLIPLRNMTILLGPNSAGKSSISEAIAIIKSFIDVPDDDETTPYNKGYRQTTGSYDDPCIGFSMPYLLDTNVIAPELDGMLSGKGAHIPRTGSGDGANGEWFILEGMSQSQYLYEPLKNTRYTFISVIEWDFPTYDVYLNNELAATRFKLAWSHVKIEIYPIANEFFLYPALLARNTSDITSTPITLTHEVSTDLIDETCLTAGHFGEITYSASDYHSSFRRNLPEEIYNESTRHNYGSSAIAFSMALALYYVPYHQFIHLIRGQDTEDVRTLSSNWFAIKLGTLDMSKPFDPLNFLAANAVFRDSALANTPEERSRKTAEDAKPRPLVIINKWLKSKAFLNTEYQLVIEVNLEITLSALDEDCSISPEAVSDLKMIFQNPDYRGPLIMDTSRWIKRFHAHAFLSDSSGRKLEFSSVGAGFSQVLPLLIGLTSGHILIFKQPEVHLHPRLQSRVADCFVETVFKEKKAKQARVRIIETHSEHFVLRLLRRLRESSFDELYHSSLTVYPEDVAFVYFQPQGSSTLVHQIAVLPSGEFMEGWPDGFFDERDEDLWGTPSPRGR